MKFPTKASIGVVQGDKKEARECYEISFKKRKELVQITSLDLRLVREDQWVNPVEELRDYPTNTVKIGYPLKE